MPRLMAWIYCDGELIHGRFQLDDQQDLSFDFRLSLHEYLLYRDTFLCTSFYGPIIIL